MIIRARGGETTPVPIDVVEMINEIDTEVDFAMMARRIDLLYSSMGARVLEGATETRLHAPRKQHYEVSENDI